VHLHVHEGYAVLIRTLPFPVPHKGEHMADVTATPDGGAQITISQSETAGLKALAAVHIPALTRAESWFSRDIAPELGVAEAFLKSLASSPPEGSTLTVTASEAQALKGMLAAHIPVFEDVLAVVESPVVKSMLAVAEALL
jgi:hypothetical protein